MENKIFIIAELGHNGGGSMSHNKLLIDEAKACGCDAVKLQLYDVDKIKKPWQSRYMELLVTQPTFEEIKELKEYADKVGIDLFASAFDVERVGWCEKLNFKWHKLASRSIYDMELIRAMEATGKPIIASLGKIDERGIPEIKNCQYLYCVSEYPAYIKEEQFPIKFGEKEMYQGFSDHSQSMYWCRESLKRGATIIEKHFTLSKDLPGHDQKGSATPTEMKDFCIYARNLERGIMY